MSTSKEDTAEKAAQLLVGFQKHLANVTSIALASAPYTAAQVTADLQQLVKLQSDVDDAKSAVKAKLAARATQAPTLISLAAALAAYVKVSFSASPDVLADFGLAAKKAKTPMTTEQQAVAVARRASTRKARGTIGKKAKQAIKGNVVDVVMTPVTASSPVVPSSPAQSAPATGNAAGGGTSHGA